MGHSLDTSPALHSLIQRIYMAGADASKWPRFLEAFCAAIDAPNGFLSFIDRANGGARASAYVGLSDDTVRLYHEQYAAIDPLAHGAAALGPLRPGFVGLVQDIISDDELARTPFYREFGQRTGMIGGLVGVIFAPGESTVAIIGANRRPGRLFGQAESDLTGALLPHLRTALQIHGELQERCETGAAAIAALEHIAVPTLICDEDGRVLYRNRSADSSPLIPPPSSHLRLNHERDTRRVLRAIALRASGVKGDGDTDTCVTLDNGTAVVTPLRMASQLPMTRQLVAVFLPSGSPSPEQVESFAGRYSLTTAETRVLRALLDSGSARDIATNLRLQYETVRTHVKRVLSKTGCSRRAELVRKVLVTIPGK